MDRNNLPVAVIGAGPVGLAAAAHLVQRGETPLVFEAGNEPGSSMLEWGHVRVFSPWRYNIDPAAQALLEETGWTMPDPESFPTGGEIVHDYLQPLAELPKIAPHIHYNSEVVAVARYGYDKLKSQGREDAPFLIRVRNGKGKIEHFFARAVIDASGTWRSPNPLGTSGIPAIGETEASDRIYYGIPDLTVRDRKRYAGKRILVIGSGHSAFNALIDIIRLAETDPDTRATWAVRRPAWQINFGGGEADELEARGTLGALMQQMVANGTVQLVTEFKTASIEIIGDGVIVSSETESLPPVDEIIATTGFRPDFTPYQELRLAFDPIVEAPPAIAPLIDPNLHSCGSVSPHGYDELMQPEQDFFMAGMKSYGRAPTFLMITGYEQVRSIIAGLTGDLEAARRVELVLPETGVCSADIGIGVPAVSCCGIADVALEPTEVVTAD